MADRTAPTLKRATPGILETKLRPPHPSSVGVRREALLHAIGTSPERSVVVLVTPLGYGKTTLLEQVAADDARPLAWLTLDKRDDDPVVLIAHLFASVTRLRAAGEDDTDHDLPPAGASVWTMQVPRLSAAIADIGPSLIVLDDVHEVTADESRDVIAWLALHVAPGSRLVLATRSAEGLPLARLRVEGRLLELGPEDLALSDIEAAALLLDAGMTIEASDAIALNRACEGWAGGLELAVLAGASDGSGRFVPRPVGSDHVISDYVRAEILARLTTEETDFLVRSSVLRQLSAPSCDAILETTGSGSLLARLERSNALVSAVDRDHTWYRCHDLFREALVAELERSHPALLPTLRHRAAEWYASRDMADEAVRYEQEAGDRAAAARMIARFAQPVFNQGRQATLIEWYDWIEPSGLIGDDPAVAMTGALVFALVGEAERSERWAAALERQVWRGGQLQDGTASIEGWRSLLRSVLGRGGVPGGLEAAGRACGLIPSSSPWRCLALTTRGMYEAMAGRTDDARTTFAEAVDTGYVRGDQPNSLSTALGLQAGLELESGRVSAAHALVAEADAVRQRSGIVEQGPQALIDALAARLAIAGGDRAEATRRLAHAQRVRPMLTWAIPSLSTVTRLQLARAHLALADPAGARTLVLEIGDILHRRPGLGRYEEEARRLREQLADIRGGIVGVSTLTTAELRLVPMLATHLSFHDIGERLFVSTNTVKTQAMSVYRKLDATSRTEAVEHAARAGLLDPAAVTSILDLARRT